MKLRIWLHRLGMLLTAIGLMGVVVCLLQRELLSTWLEHLSLSLVGFGPLVELFWSGSQLPFPLAWNVAALWTAVVAGGLVLWAATSPPSSPALPASTSGAAHVGLLQFRDFYWPTFLVYAAGILLAELSFLTLYTEWVLGGGGGAWTPIAALSLAGILAFMMAFASGTGGAVLSRQFAIPEATLALVYCGLPLPLFLIRLHTDGLWLPEWQIRLREVMHLASLLGEENAVASYLLGFVVLLIGFFFGICLGFVVASSGKWDTRLGFELFVASKHLQIFKPRALLRVLVVLLMGIFPPLLIWWIVTAAESRVELARIKKLGERNPLAAEEALARRKLRQNKPSELMASLAVAGVGVGVMALIIVLSVMSGFSNDMQKKILGTNAHGIIITSGSEMAEPAEVMKRVEEVPGVTGLTPFIFREVMISSQASIAGAIIKGIEPQSIGSVTDLPEYMLHGAGVDVLLQPEKVGSGAGVLALEPLFPGGVPKELEEDGLIEISKTAPKVVLPGIIVGREMAAQLRVVVGDRLNVVSPLGGELGPQGPMPKSRAFRVVGLFHSGMYDYDSKMVYIELKEAADFFNIEGATGLEFKVKDVDSARRIAKRIREVLGGYPYVTRDWGEMNRALFAALRLEKLAMGIILSIIIVVAVGLIVATMIMLGLEKRRELSVLKALGVSNGGIVKLFMVQGLQIGITGGALGLISGIVWCLAIQKMGLQLDPKIYYIPSLPVHLDGVQVLLAFVIAVLVTFLASVYPAIKASQVEPAEGLKSE
ncbi:MAG: ABC transporter permease [Proteobacteria bacterium]|nr:ABC transporter permease [Cystobacterineae bacterium]MCL2259290.1 ABC transporter permease [Cystobacterineae bacterium]MCL2314287.1 ABC transporter permease [Pseudomonadota bacterium]